MDPIQFYKLLADETRLKILLLILKRSELCVCELTEALDEIQPKISRHLALLRKQQVLLGQRRGQWVYYQLHPELDHWAQSVLQQTLAANAGLIQPNLDQLCELDACGGQAKVCG